MNQHIWRIQLAFIKQDYFMKYIFGTFERSNQTKKNCKNG